MHGFIHHKHLVDQGLAYFSDRFLLPDSSLSINWPALASFIIYSSIFTVVYPITFAFSLLYSLLYYALLLLFYLLRSGLHLIIWPFSWLTIFEPLYIYLSFAILIGLSAGLILYGISEGISHCLEQIASYFGTATPLRRHRRGGGGGGNGSEDDDEYDGNGDVNDKDDRAHAITRPLLLKQEASTGDSFIHDWMDFEDEEGGMMSSSSFTRYRRTGEGEGEGDMEDSRMRIKKEKKEKKNKKKNKKKKHHQPTVVWISPPAKDLALFPLSRIMDEERDEPNYDSDESEEGEGN